MGRRLAGKYLQWPKTSEVTAEIRCHAIEQAIRIYEQGALRKDDPPLWGDEIEYALVTVDEEKKEAKLCLEQRKILGKIEDDQNSNGTTTSRNNDKKVRGDLAEYELEFSRYMIESNPGCPYGDSASDLLKVESSMAQRRKYIDSHSPQCTHPFTVSFFPALGLPDGVDNDESDTDVSKVNGLDAVVSNNSRHQAVRTNIGLRRERPFEFNTPLFVDQNTNTSNFKVNGLSKYPIVPLENPIFGAGHCGLQVTFQASSEAEILMIHDQLVPFGPILLALTASTPICNGYLKDIDVRWNQLTDSVDDRQKSECKTIMPRCFANNLYLSNDSRLPSKYQRDDLHIDQDIRKRLEDGGLPPQLAKYFALSLSRDALAISESDLQDSTAANSTLAFDILDGCDWPHINLKLPSLTDKNLGWRIEFRTMETQFTDFENAAFCLFLALVKSVIIKYKLNIYVPILAVQENMQRAHALDAVTAEKFLFRCDPFGNGDRDEDFAMLSVNDIVNGSTSYVGMIPLIERYMNDGAWTEEHKRKVNTYLHLVRRRASGEYWTTAKWMREFVLRHADYKQDSRVSGKMCLEMMREVMKMMEGERRGRMFEKA